MKLTKNSIQTVAPPERGDVFIQDDTLPGFFLKVTSSGLRSYYVKKKSGGKLHKVKICDAGVLNLDNARAQAQEILAQLARGEDPIAQRKAIKAAAVTLREALDGYLSAKSDRDKPGTLQHYRIYFGLVPTRTGAFTDWLDWPLAKITESLVLKKHRELGQQRGQALANLAMRYLSAVLEFAFWEHRQADGTPLFQVNPVKVLRHTRAWYKVRRCERYIPRSRLPEWWAAWKQARVEHADMCDLLFLYVTTGMRLSEGASLKWEQVNFDARTVRLLDTKARNDVTLPLPSQVVEMLRRRLRDRVGDFVFPSDGKTGHLTSPYKACNKITASCGIEFSPHDLRRTHHTVAAEIGIDGLLIDRLQNHAVSQSIMRERYFIASADGLRDAAERIAEAVVGGLYE